MKVLVLYRPQSEFARSVEEFLHDLQEVHGIDDRNLQVVDYDSREGNDKASAYGIMTHPAIIITDDDGAYIKHWEGSKLPLQNEVTGYVYSSTSA